MTTQTHRFSTRYCTIAKLLHLGLAVCGTIAFFTGELAEDKLGSTGYLIHAFFGLALTGFIIARLILGLSSMNDLSFKGWSPLSRLQWQDALTDIAQLFKGKLPDRPPHSGLAGIVQALGLAAFAWMAITGSMIYILADNLSHDTFEILEEAHEFGQSFIIAYLLMHIGAVVLHSIGGSAVWQNMFRRS